MRTTGKRRVGMSSSVTGWMSAVVVGTCLAVLGGCATPQAADPRGKWRPLHQFSEVPQAIPLEQAYVFQAFPSDQTLKSLLARWSSDAGLRLSYLHGNDYTLHAPVARLRTTSIEEAAHALTAAYAAQGVQVSAERGAIVVSRAQAAEAGAAGGAD